MAKGHPEERRTGLARVLSKMGHCSRSQAAALVCAGRVSLNQIICRDPEWPVCIGRDRIDVDGSAVLETPKLYFMLNKPRGAVTTVSDEQGRETVYNYLSNHLKNGLPWIAPVGRLDKASEGLLLLTNDSAWSARILAPETHLDKTYHVHVNALADENLIQRLLAGVNDDRELLRVKNVSVLRRGQRNSWLEIVLDEGKNRHIRRMLAALGLEVLRLVRVAIGPLPLGKLAKGECRPLTKEEKKALDRALQNAEI